MYLFIISLGNKIIGKSNMATPLSNMRQVTCLKDEVLKFQYDDPYPLASPDAITNNFDDIDRGIW